MSSPVTSKLKFLGADGATNIGAKNNLLQLCGIEYGTLGTELVMVLVGVVLVASLTEDKLNGIGIDRGSCDSILYFFLLVLFFFVVHRQLTQ